MDCHTLPRGAGMQGLPSLKGFQWNSRSLSGAIWSGNLVILKTLHVARRDSMAPPVKGGHCHQHPGKNNWLVHLPLVSQPHQSQKRLHHQRNSPLWQDEDHWHPMAFPFYGQMSLPHLHQSRQTCPWAYPLGAQLDQASLESLQVTISHFRALGKVQCEYQSWTVALTSLTQVSTIGPTQTPHQPNSSPWIKWLWTCVMIFTWPMSN